MLRNIMITGTAICLAMASGLARADHDRQLSYVVGGAILGAALGELAYASGHGGNVAVDYRYGYGYDYSHRYNYRPGIAYAPPRFPASGHYRYWGPDYRHGHTHRAGHRNRHYRR